MSHCEHLFKKYMEHEIILEIVIIYQFGIYDLRMSRNLVVDFYCVMYRVGDACLKRYNRFLRIFIVLYFYPPPLLHTNKKFQGFTSLAKNQKFTWSKCFIQLNLWISTCNSFLIFQYFLRVLIFFLFLFLNLLRIIFGFYNFFPRS